MNQSIFKTFRDKVEISQSALADAIQVKQSAIANYEAGKRQPHINVARRFIALAASHGYSYTLDDVYLVKEQSVA